jgi:hypothetical protein
MMKLARNAFNEYQIIDLPGVGKAKWRNVNLLHKKQTDEGLVLGNKLTKSHLNYKNQKMKVKLAVQAFSSSCSKALQYLRTSSAE